MNDALRIHELNLGEPALNLVSIMEARDECILINNAHTVVIMVVNDTET
jgi:hypothetical protein